MPFLNYHHLRYFRFIAREKNLTRAAAKLNLSVPALSIQLKQLEESLGHPLFDRVPGGLDLTEAGSIALGYAGWEAGQLEQEIRDNSWLAVEAADDVIFDLPFDERWPAALRLLGVEASQLAAFAGHA